MILEFNKTIKMIGILLVVVFFCNKAGAQKIDDTIENLEYGMTLPRIQTLGANYKNAKIDFYDGKRYRMIVDMILFNEYAVCNVYFDEKEGIKTCIVRFANCENRMFQLDGLALSEECKKIIKKVEKNYKNKFGKPSLLREEFPLNSIPEKRWYSSTSKITFIEFKDLPPMLVFEKKEAK